MKLDETLLSRAAVLVRDRELQQLPDEKDCPEYVFSCLLYTSRCV